MNSEELLEQLESVANFMRGMWRTVKYKAHNADFSEILWPGLHTCYNGRYKGLS